MTPTLHPPRVLALGAQKGGAAKTTSSLYLATRAAERLGGSAERPVVGLLDRDTTSKTLTEMLDYRPELLRPGVVLLPGEQLPAPDCGLQLVVIDTPPGLSAVDALKSAHMLVVPVVPSDPGLLNLVRYLRAIEAQRLTLTPNMRLLALLPVMVARTTLHRARLESIRAIARAHRPPLPVLTPVPQRAGIDAYDLSAREYDPAAEELFAHALSLTHQARSVLARR